MPIRTDRLPICCVVYTGALIYSSENPVYVGAIILPISQVRKSGQRGKGSCPELHSEFVVKPEKVELEAR